MTNLEDNIDDLLFDCEIADCGLMPRTFWMPVDGTKPRCLMEQMALQIFQHHVSADGYDPSTSGAEWWVQIRPSPPGMGRYALLKEDDDGMAKEGISFHWDKDEDLRLLAGGSLYVHPHLSTVTYLSSFGAPTMICDYRIHALTGEWISPETMNDARAQGFLSWPLKGKHLSFDARLLHAAPSNLMKEGEFAEQCRVPVESTSDEGKRKVLQRRHRRVTFLVNIWLNHKPFNIEVFPESMIDKLTKVTNGSALFDDKAPTLPVRRIEVANDGTNALFSWPMGACNSNETIAVPLPLDEIRIDSQKGANIELLWHKDAPPSLSKGDSNTGQKGEVQNEKTEGGTRQRLEDPRQS